MSDVIAERRRQFLRSLVDQESAFTGTYGAKKRVAERLGMDPSHFSQVLSGHRDCGEDLAIKICMALKLPLGTMEQDPSHGSRPLPMLDRNVSPYEPSRPRRPVVASVVAGNFRDAVPARTPSDEPWYEHPRFTHSSDQAVWLIVEGDSMDDGTSNGFRESDLILVDPDAPWESGDFVIIANGGDEWTFKRIRKDGPAWFMEALNPGYQPRAREIPEGWRVVGKVLEVMPRGRKVG